MKWGHLFMGVCLLFPIYLSGQTVMSLKIDGAITEPIASYLHRGINTAVSDDAEAALIEINTPGGMLKSTRKIVGDIMNSPIPVIVFVYPKGSRAGSAGLFITLSGDIAAMAPGTNIGASHPIVMRGNLDSIENAKVTNDALAFIRSIAQKRNKNADWAEKAVSQSMSFTAKEALQKNLINLMASNPQELLKKLDGDSVSTAAGKIKLHTAGAVIKPIPKSFSEKLTILLSHPNLMYILLLVGLFGILFEFFNPGGVLPGVIGGIALILAFYSMSILPVNYAGLALIIFAIILFVLELKIVSHGILAIGGIVALFLGSMMLVQTPSGASVLKISLGVIITATILSAAFFLFAIGIGLRAQRNKITSGREGLIGKQGIVLHALHPSGKIKVVGEIWNAESKWGRIDKGQKVSVTGMDNLKLWVKAVLPEKKDADGKDSS